jgi:AraC-like DNA-binding protein
MDPLTDILTAMHVRKATFYRLDARAPWGFSSPGEPAIKFVYVVRGAGILSTATQPNPIALRSGDVFIMFDDEPYSIYDDQSSAMIDCMEVKDMRVGSRIEVGGSGALTTFISGYFTIDAHDIQPLLAVLPKFLHLKSERDRTLAFQSVLEMLAVETENPSLGTEAVISRLFELMFVHAIRAYSAQHQALPRGWLAAISHKNLGEAVRALHANLERGWTVESLARVAGMSRSAFAYKFKNVVGETPLEYLTRWRMQKAAGLIRRGNLSLSDICTNVGYDSEAAFNRMFKRTTGMTPGAFRHQLRANHH